MLHGRVNEIVEETGLSGGRHSVSMAGVKELLPQLTPLQVLRLEHLSVHKVSIMAINPGRWGLPLR